MTAVNEFIITIVMSVIAGILACFIGRLLGKGMMLFKKGGLEEKTDIFNVINAVNGFFKFIPYILLLLLLDIWLGAYLTRPYIIAVSIFFELLPLFTFSVYKAMNKVPQDVIDAAVAMGSETDEILELFVLPDARGEINKKNIRTLFYGLLCTVGAYLWLHL
ncbi:MAG: hypothetical protein J6O71_04980 [Lachnospiraceae bacterium]|nr:hypothetical protein [Lachnospiraceae bacterium]